MPNSVSKGFDIAIRTDTRLDDSNDTLQPLCEFFKPAFDRGFSRVDHDIPFQTEFCIHFRL